MNGFTVTNGMIKMLITGKNYIKVGEDRYLYRKGSLEEIIENEYDSHTYISDWLRYMEEYYGKVPDLEDFYSPYHNESELLKVSLVIKNGEKLKGHGVHVWQPLVNTYAVYYAPYEEPKNMK